jgi:hypothetical protein
VLLTYTLHLSSRPLLAALAGGLSVLCRQTNIIWVFLAAAETAGRVVVSEVRAHQAATRQPTLALTTAGQLAELVQGLAGLAITRPASLARLVGLVVLRCVGYIAIGLGFLAFLHLNQGIVVGDRSAHTATLHLLQIGYFSAFYLCLSLPWADATLRALPALLRAHRLKLLVAVVVLGTVVHWGTLAHPYLLADNRHFTFYLWRRVFMRHWTFKYLLIPVYMFGFLHIGRSLSKCDLTLKLALPVCLALSLVPQLLLEFRYFIIPFLLVRAQVSTSTGPAHAAAPRSGLTAPGGWRRRLSCSSGSTWPPSASSSSGPSSGPRSPALCSVSCGDRVLLVPGPRCRDGSLTSGMSSRLDRLFILLESGSSPATRRAAASQLGEVAAARPGDLGRLLARLRALLAREHWDTRVAAAQALEAVLAKVPVWPAEETEAESGLLSLAEFDLERVVRTGRCLMASEGREFDREGKEVGEQWQHNTALQEEVDLGQQRARLHQTMGLDMAERLGFQQEGFIEDSDLRTAECPQEPDRRQTASEVLAAEIASVTGVEVVTY